MPKLAHYTLAWTPFHHAYHLQQSQGNEALDIIPESPSWWGWVSQTSSFAFHGKHGSYTARKECKQRGEGYWYAYARVGGKLTKSYLGSGRDLTLARLEQVAQELGRDPQAVLSADSLLATKLHAPRPLPHLVHRPRLIQRLQQGMERALTLLSAPAGFGKSTLLSDWLISRAIPAAWLSLEPQDNEPTCFLAYLFAALQTYDPHLGTSAQAVLHSLQPAPLEAVLTLLINDLLMRRTDNQEPFVLVLDNYQVITAEAIHHALSFLLNHLPSQMHLVLATRVDPPLPLAQMRGRGALLELRVADLQFTQEEAATYLVEVVGLLLSQEESALLQARTEGWITGLQLAALSLQGRDDLAGFITAFSGSHHYVMDYLLEEVLKCQPQAIQDFLLQTCILDRLSGPLCDAVRAQDDSQTQLDALERANLFLVALDDERQWYRYHRLFAQMLRQRLQQTAPVLISKLHRRASRWYEQHGFFAEAVSHALAAPAPEAARSIAQYAAVCHEQTGTVPPLPALCSTVLLEPLTRRELEVLRLLATGASNSEIARNLVLSVGTVKKHVYNLCGKLGVKSRTQALVKARALNLLTNVGDQQR
jgi:LuxR family transcriptional regulator, maltose regulon positive regulatory protein